MTDVNTSGVPGYPFTNIALQNRYNHGYDGFSICVPRQKYTYLLDIALNPSFLINPHCMETDLVKHIRSGRLFTTIRSVDRPQVTFHTEKLRSYNKHVIVPTKSEYTPVTLVFHDDNTSVASALWRESRAFYQYEGRIRQTNDPTRTFRLNHRLIDARRDSGDEDAIRVDEGGMPSLGMTMKTDDARHLIESITIYDLGADSGSVNIYVFVYPMITTANYDTLDDDDNQGQMIINMTLDYEACYHLIGQTNEQFNGIFQQIFGFEPAGDTTRGEHAKMRPEILDLLRSNLPKYRIPTPDLGANFGLDVLFGDLNNLNNFRGVLREVAGNVGRDLARNATRQAGDFLVNDPGVQESVSNFREGVSDIGEGISNTASNIGQNIRGRFSRGTDSANPRTPGPNIRTRLRSIF